VVEKLKKFGAKEQLLMCVMDPAGVGNRTAIEVAWQIWFEFCKSMDIFWKSKHFYLQQLLGVQLHHLEKSLCTVRPISTQGQKMFLMGCFPYTGASLNTVKCGG